MGDTRELGGHFQLVDDRIHVFVGQLAPRQPQVPPLGVYRSVDGLIGLLLDVSWITNNYTVGPTNVNDFLSSPTLL